MVLITATVSNLYIDGLNAGHSFVNRDTSIRKCETKDRDRGSNLVSGMDYSLRILLSTASGPAL
jgi:hypothetical protein